MRRFFQSLRTRLCFTILFICALIFLSVGYVYFAYSSEREERMAIEYTSTLLENMVLEIDLQRIKVEHTVDRTVPLVEEHIAHTGMLAPIISRMVGSDSVIMGGCVARVADSPDERFMEYVWRDSVGNLHDKVMDDEYDYCSQDWFRDALSGDRGIWSEPYFDKGGGDRTMTTYSLPLKDSRGRTYAVLTADVAVNDLLDTINDLRFYEDSQIFLLTDRGTYMTQLNGRTVIVTEDTDIPDRYANPELVRLDRSIREDDDGYCRLTLDDEDVLAFYTLLPGMSCTVCILCPYDTIMSELVGTAVVSYILFAVGLILLTFGIRWTVKREMVPLEQFADAANHVAKGNFSTPLPDVTARREMQLLHSSFAFMQRSLVGYVEELKRTTMARERLESELKIARALQMSLLPHDFPPFPGCRDIAIRATLNPAKEVGGDLYDFLFRDGKLFFTVADVSGKGIPASLFMATTKSLFRFIARDHDAPADIAALLNHAIAENNEANMFVTMFIGILDPVSGVLRFCNAGHNPPVRIPSGDGECSILSVRPNMPIGIIDDFEFVEEEVLLGGDALLLYTDGLTEAENGGGVMLGMSEVLGSLAAMKDRDAEKVIARMTSLVKDFVGDAPQSDDLTLMYVAVRRDDDAPADSQVLTVANRVEEVARLEEFLEDVARKYGIPPESLMKLNLALEEALVNVIRYAYPENSDELINLTSYHDTVRREIVFLLSDSGKPFDPTAVPDPPAGLSLEEQPIGGLGIAMVKQIMDSVEYERKDGCNLLTMRKRMT